MSISSLKTGVVSPSSLLAGNAYYIPPVPFSANILLIAGGGGSPNFGVSAGPSGGGGAGGVFESSVTLASNVTFTVTVGAGGANTSGSNSTVSGGGYSFTDSVAGGRGGGL